MERTRDIVYLRGQAKLRARAQRSARRSVSEEDALDRHPAILVPFKRQNVPERSNPADGTWRYGWALAFTPEKRHPEREPATLNVCMYCGAGFDERPVRIALVFYRCPDCAGLNYLFGQGAGRRAPRAS